MAKKKTTKKAVHHHRSPSNTHTGKGLKQTIHPLTSLTIVFYILLGILFLAIYLTRFA